MALKKNISELVFVARINEGLAIEEYLLSAKDDILGLIELTGSDILNMGGIFIVVDFLLE